MLKLLEKIQFNCSITFNSLKFNWLSLKKCLIFDKICLKKLNRQKNMLLCYLGKMLLGKLELGKKSYLGKMLHRQE